MLNVALCDDEAFWFDRIQAIFDERQDVSIATTCYTSGEALLADCRNRERPFDAIFLDMEMLGMTGLEIAKTLRGMDREVILVFVTSHTRFMKASIAVRPLRFVEKANLDEEISEAVDAILDELEENSYSLVFSDNKKDVHLYYKEILVIESKKHYVDIYTTSGIYRKRTSLTQLESTLKSEIFSRSHRSFLVNLRHVRTFDENGVVVRGFSPPSVPLGEKYEKCFRAACKRYFERKAGL